MGNGQVTLEELAGGTVPLNKVETPTAKAQTIVFHARPSKTETHPSHTLCFHTQGDVLLCTYAKPHPGLESYCKATGRDLTERRMNVLLEEIKEEIPASPETQSITTFKRNVPACIRRTLKYYVKSAQRYFKMAEEAKTMLVFRGQYADWQTYMESGRKCKVPVKAVHLTRYVDEL